ncbi:YbhB/YbcL family Raf kinase inhibitor-like protein [Actinomadura craniellae]|uniref:YbhB/YbcL family Raf kinase inhibitor-like protein n=1 Tax=Actinomadura craniellae TaxID=2231787 RepID=A0A365GVU3_9ACTN|nr:YbhB/YbcL family Raf kinase inhibitor-like protein [Actinomadura craniellae]RAY10912.1 YbhB/YbcL family Raf kinase inhibitor-like protein [Actinomadura craniellae]
MKSTHRRSVRRFRGAAVALLAASGLAGCGLPGQTNTSPELAEWFTVTSPAFRDGTVLPARFVCATYPGGEGKTPPLHWSGTPASTRAFAIVVDDPDAPEGAAVLWVIANLGGTTTSIVEGARPDNTVEALNTDGRVGYRAPCPPKGERNRYRFTVYALSEPVPLTRGAPLKQALGTIAKHTVGRGRITGNFGNG